MVLKSKVLETADKKGKSLTFQGGKKNVKIFVGGNEVSGLMKKNFFVSCRGIKIKKSC
jgi:hypothetical protein